MTALISHELRHVCEQYVLEFDNVIKGSLNYDFKHNNPFQLSTKSETYIKLRNIIYYLSDEEQRARMQATWNVCEYAMENNSTRSQLTASYYKTKDLVDRYGITRQADKNFRTEIVSALKSEPLRFAHHLPEFRKAVNEITPIGHIKTIYKVLLLLGYFLEKNNYIKSGNNKDVKQFFSKLSVIEKFSKPISEKDMPYYDIILRTVYNNYHKYENIIYNIIGINIEKIIHYKNNEDNIIT